MDEATLPNRRLRLNYPVADPQWWCMSEDSLDLGQPWKSRAELGISGIPWGRMGEAAPQPMSSGCCARQKHRGSRILQPGGVSCWPLLTEQSSLISDSFRCLCTHHTLFGTAKPAQLVTWAVLRQWQTQAASEVQSAGRCILYCNSWYVGRNGQILVQTGFGYPTACLFLQLC